MEGQVQENHALRKCAFFEAVKIMYTKEMI